MATIREAYGKTVSLNFYLGRNNIIPVNGSTNGATTTLEVEPFCLDEIEQPIESPTDITPSVATDPGSPGQLIVDVNFAIGSEGALPSLIRCYLVDPSPYALSNSAPLTNLSGSNIQSFTDNDITLGGSYSLQFTISGFDGIRPIAPQAVVLVTPAVIAGTTGLFATYLLGKMAPIIDRNIVITSTLDQPEILVEDSGLVTISSGNIVIPEDTQNCTISLKGALFQPRNLTPYLYSIQIRAAEREAMASGCEAKATAGDKTICLNSSQSINPKKIYGLQIGGEYHEVESIISSSGCSGFNGMSSITAILKTTLVNNHTASPWVLLGEGDSPDAIVATTSGIRFSRLGLVQFALNTAELDPDKTYFYEVLETVGLSSQIVAVGKLTFVTYA